MRRATCSLLGLVAWLPLPSAVAMAQTPPLKLVALEINQGVQNLSNAVPLVAGRDAIVRAYVSTTSGTTTLTATLVMSRPDGAPDRIPLADPVVTGVVTDARLAAMRWDQTQTLNFDVPGQMMRGNEVSMTIELFRNGQRQPCEGCDVPLTRSLLPVPPLRVRIVALRYQHDHRTFEPRTEDWNRIQLWLERAYPVPSVILSSKVVNANVAWPFDCTQAMTQMSELRSAEVGNAANVDPRTHYYAVVFAEDLATFMRGCADVPEAPEPGAVGAGPTGAVTNFPDFAWDQDGSFGDWYTGHELGHTFGRAHPGQCGSSLPLDPAFFPDEAGHIKSVHLAQSSDARDDAGLDHRTAAWQVLPGSAWNDMMDYCPNSWVGPDSYEAIARRLIGEETLLAAPPQLTGLTPHVVAAGATPGGPQSTALPSIPPAPPQKTTPADDALKPTAEGQFLTLIARVNRQAGTGVVDSIVPVRRTFSKSYGTPLDPASGATLRVLYRSSETRVYGCDMRAISRDPGNPITRDQPAPDQPTPPGATATPGAPQAAYDTTVTCTFPSGGIPDRATVLIDGKPVAEHVSPRGNVQLTSASPIGAGAGGPGGPLTYRWTPSGQSPNTRYLVKISVDGGQTWDVLAVGLKETQIQIPAADIKGASQILVEITAIDGMRTALIERKVISGPPR
jgi:hypothetical protein